MNDMEALKDFRAELGRNPDEEQVRSSWLVLSERLGTTKDPSVIRTRRPRRRWAVLGAAGVAAAALVFVLTAILPSGAPGGARKASAAVSFSTEGQYIVAVIKDPQADSQELRAAFAEHGLDITLELVPVSPSLVGKFVYEGASGTEGGPPIETLFDDNADCTTPGALSCPIGLRIPLDFQGHADLSLGRAGEPGEQYVTTNDAFAPGEALHCTGLRGMTVQQALPVLDQLGVTAVWRSHDLALDNGEGVDPSTIADEYVTDASPVAQGQVLVWASPEQPTQPEPGTPLAQYFARLNAGC